MTEEQKRQRNIRQETWKKENRERINILFEKGTKERIKVAATQLNIKISEFIRQAVEEKLQKIPSIEEPTREPFEESP